MFNPVTDVELRQIIIANISKRLFLKNRSSINIKTYIHTHIYNQFIKKLSKERGATHVPRKYIKDEPKGLI